MRRRSNDIVLQAYGRHQHTHLPSVEGDLSPSFGAAIAERRDMIIIPIGLCLIIVYQFVADIMERRWWKNLYKKRFP